MRIPIILILSLLSSSALSAENLFTKQPTVTPKLAASGEWKVGVQTLKVVNPQQLSSQDFNSLSDRSLTLEVWYPAATDGDRNLALATYDDVTRTGKSFSLLGEAYRDSPISKVKERFPLVVISHGYTGYRSQLFYLGEHLASHGYVVASIDHTDSTNADIVSAENPGSGFASTLLNRSRDQLFVLNSLMAESAFSDSLKRDSAAVIGYSMGGYGALNSVGGCYNFSPKLLQSMQFPEPAAEQLAPLFNSCNGGKNETDPRWKAMISLAPWGGEQNVHKLDNVTLPALIIAGEQDDVSGYQNGVKKLFDQLDSNDKYLLVYENARHNIAGHPAPKVAYTDDFDLGHYYEPSWNSEAITRINEHLSLAFLNCHVKGDTDACAHLPNTGHATQSKGTDNKLSAAWPGFPERWATGLRFVRGQ